MKSYKATERLPPTLTHLLNQGSSKWFCAWERLFLPPNCACWIKNKHDVHGNLMEGQLKGMLCLEAPFLPANCACWIKNKHDVHRILYNRKKALYDQKYGRVKWSEFGQKKFCKLSKIKRLRRAEDPFGVWVNTYGRKKSENVQKWPFSGMAEQIWTMVSRITQKQILEGSTFLF